MPTVSVRSHENNRWTRKEKAEIKRNKEVTAKLLWKSWWVCFGFKLGFLQWISKACLVFKLNLGLSLSTIINERHLCK